MTPSPRRRRLARIAAAACWFGLAFWFARATLKTRDANAEHLIASALLAYLAAWCPILALSQRSPGGKLARFAACTLSIVLAIAIVEVPAAIGLIDFREVFHTPTPPWKRSGNLPDADLLYARRPNQRLKLWFQGSDRHALRDVPAAPAYACDTTLDGLGFRNPVGIGSAEVVLVGDSFVEGLQVRDDELVSARLAALIDAPVANLGRTGYGPRQEQAVLDRYAAGFGPRTCVWFFYEGNDLQDLAGYEAERKRVEALRPESPRKAWYARSFARNAAGWLTRPGSGVTALASARAGSFREASGHTSDLFFSCGVHEGDAEAVAGRASAEAMEQLRRVFADAQASCRAKGMDLLFAFVPSKFRVYHDFCRFAADSPCPGWAVDDLPTAIEEAVRTAAPGAAFLDLNVAMKARAKAGELVYLSDDTHWSAAGHRVAAAAVADALRSRPPGGTVAKVTSAR